MGKDISEQMREEHAEREKRMTLHYYIRSRLPRETHRNPVVCAVMDLHLRKEQSSGEECLLDMVRALCRANADLHDALVRRLELAPPMSMLGKGESDAR